MEALLYNSLLVTIPIILSYAIGFCMRLLFGVFIHGVIIGAEIALPPDTTWFITFSSFIIWLGYFTAPKVAVLVDGKAEDSFTSDAFDETYRKYAQAQKQPKLKNSAMKVITGMTHKIIMSGVKTLIANPQIPIASRPKSLVIKTLVIKILAIKKLSLIAFHRKTKCWRL